MMNIQKFATVSGTTMKVKEDEGFKTLTLLAVDATDGITFNTKGLNNDGIVLIAQNTNASAAKNVVIKAPKNGSYAAADADLTLSLPAGGIAVARISTAAYANNDGTVVVSGGSADVKVQAIYR
jgi:hypothetical protein